MYKITYRSDIFTFKREDRVHIYTVPLTQRDCYTLRKISQTDTLALREFLSRRFRPRFRFKTARPALPGLHITRKFLF